MTPKELREMAEQAFFQMPCSYDDPDLHRAYGERLELILNIPTSPGDLGSDSTVSFDLDGLDPDVRDKVLKARGGGS